MKFIVLVSLLSSFAIAAPLFDFSGGIAAVDAGDWSILSPQSDTFKYNYNGGFGNYKGPQYAPYNAGAFNPYGFAPPGLPYGAGGQAQAPGLPFGAGGQGQVPGLPFGAGGAGGQGQAPGLPFSTGGQGQDPGLRSGAVGAGSQAQTPGAPQGQGQRQGKRQEQKQEQKQ